MTTDKQAEIKATDAEQTTPVDLTPLQGKPDKAGQPDTAGKTGEQLAVGEQIAVEKTAKADKRSADDTNLTAKSAPPSPADGKPVDGNPIEGSPVDGKPAEATPSDADKQHIAHARGEVSANSHEAAKTDAPATAPASTTVAAGKAAADSAPPQFLTATSHSAAASSALPSAAAHTAPQAAAVPLAGVAIEIAGKALAGMNRFDIRLDPPELGRIEVRLDVDRNGHVTSRLIADRSDTLDLLRRDSAGLERALQDAGLKTSDNGMQFSLRDHSTGQEQRRNGAETAHLLVTDETPPVDAMPQGYGRSAGRIGGLDIRV